MLAEPACVLTAEQLAQLPSEDDVAFYEEHGWYVSEAVLGEAALDRARAGAERFYRGERDAPLPLRSGYQDWRPEQAAMIRNNEFVSLQNRELDRLVRQPVIGAIAARLARTRSVRLLDDQLVYKEAGDRGRSTVVGWHADHAYWGTCSSDNMLTAWIPFHDVDEARSPLVVIDGSHRWPGLAHTRFFNDQNLEGFEERLARSGHEVRKVPIILRKGQISFHHCWTLHASLPNRSGHSRLALSIHLQDEANRYRACTAPDGSEVHIADELLCRRLPTGEPDFHDPGVFPTLWGEAPAVGGAAG